MSETTRRGRRGRQFWEMPFDDLLDRRRHQQGLERAANVVARGAFGAAALAEVLGENKEQARERGRFTRGRETRATAPTVRKWSAASRRAADLAARGASFGAKAIPSGIAAFAETSFSQNVADADAEIARRARRNGLDPDLNTDRLINDLQRLPPERRGASRSGPRGTPSQGSSARRMSRERDDPGPLNGAKDVASAINDPRYRKDPAYRARVAQRLATSPAMRVRPFNDGL